MLWQVTPASSYPTQNTYNLATGAVVGSSNARILPITVYGLDSVMGVVNNIKQSAFSAAMSSALTNVTGDGTAYDLVTGTSLFDGNGDLTPAVATLFTAPAKGFYQFNGAIALQGIAAAHTQLQLHLVVNSVAIQRLALYNPWAIAAGGQYLNVPVSCIRSLNKGDTVGIRITVSNGTKVVGVLGETIFCGSLIA